LFDWPVKLNTFDSQKSLEGDLRTTRPDRSGRFRSSWPSMLYPRVSLARQFLNDDGYIGSALMMMNRPT
jgi:adenine-specific DNA-methyltransferase